MGSDIKTHEQNRQVLNTLTAQTLILDLIMKCGQQNR
jgi:hypothetical protein